MTRKAMTWFYIGEVAGVTRPLGSVVARTRQEADQLAASQWGDIVNMRLDYAYRDHSQTASA